MLGSSVNNHSLQYNPVLCSVLPLTTLTYQLFHRVISLDPLFTPYVSWSTYQYLQLFFSPQLLTADVSLWENWFWEIFLYIFSQNLSGHMEHTFFQELSLLFNKPFYIFLLRICKFTTPVVLFKEVHSFRDTRILYWVGIWWLAIFQVCTVSVDDRLLYFVFSTCNPWGREWNGHWIMMQTIKRSKLQHSTTALSIETYQELMGKNVHVIYKALKILLHSSCHQDCNENGKWHKCNPFSLQSLDCNLVLSFSRDCQMRF